MNHAFFFVQHPQAICLYNLYDGVASFSDNWRKDAGKIRFFDHISIEKIFDINQKGGFLPLCVPLSLYKTFLKVSVFLFSYIFHGLGSRFLICHVADGWYLRKFEPLLPWPFPKSCKLVIGFDNQHLL